MLDRGSDNRRRFHRRIVPPSVPARLVPYELILASRCAGALGSVVPRHLTADGERDDVVAGIGVLDTSGSPGSSRVVVGHVAIDERQGAENSRCRHHRSRFCPTLCWNGA